MQKVHLHKWAGQKSKKHLCTHEFTRTPRNISETMGCSLEIQKVHLHTWFTRHPQGTFAQMASLEVQKVFLHKRVHQKFKKYTCQNDFTRQWNCCTSTGTRYDRCKNSKCTVNEQLFPVLRMLPTLCVFFVGNAPRMCSSKYEISSMFLWQSAQRYFPFR